MTNLFTRTWHRVLATLAVCLLALTACGHSGGGTSQGSSSSSHVPVSASSAEAKAIAPATAANQQLTADKYTPLNTPGFGKFDVGVSSSAPYRYEAVYVGQNADAIRTAVDEANKNPQPGVTVQVVNNNRVVVRANHLKDLEKAAKNIAKNLA